MQDLHRRRCVWEKNAQQRSIGMMVSNDQVDATRATLRVHDISQYKDAKTLFETIQARFGGNDATKKTQRTLLKQMYENFNAPSTESLDSIFNRL
nr:hypothetical protein [Tanacetum cinerariifolium]